MFPLIAHFHCVQIFREGSLQGRIVHEGLHGGTSLLNVDTEAVEFPATAAILDRVFLMSSSLTAIQRHTLFQKVIG